MAVGDFSAAAKCTPIAIELKRLFNEGLTADQQPKAPMSLLKTVAENHGMKGAFQRGNEGLTYNAFWTQDCDYDPAYAGTVFDATVACDIPSGVEDGGEYGAYKPNVYISDPRSFIEVGSDNQLFGVNRSASRIFAAIKAIRHKLSDDWAAFMSTNAQVNSYPGLGTIVGTTTTFGSADFTADLLYHWQLIAAQNEINEENLQIVNGTNLWELGKQAMNGACCGDQSDRNAFGLMNVTWDKWLDTSLGTASSFVFDPTALGFFNFTKYDNTLPERLHGSATQTAEPNAATEWSQVGEIFKWKVDDPMYNWMSVNENGQMSLVPISYDIEYKKECSARDAVGYLRYKHTFYVTFSGGRFLAPAGCNSNTHILEMVQV